MLPSLLSSLSVLAAVVAIVADNLEALEHWAHDLASTSVLTSSPPTSINQRFPITSIQHIHGLVKDVSMRW
ncbi:hypothetical protein C8R43DRAFT_283005 [Mycena crocata]|nr:hypothetical protein C8R43DRAFT_1123070 [Mycena crocata]KAJ7163464.1 hypothetical protein C8R43DRAFT_1123073 [Mycena crocata]KAJ7163468.1 hypothetical protein C8R43DRAFT_283005 [Mycena crocata]